MPSFSSGGQLITGEHWRDGTVEATGLGGGPGNQAPSTPRKPPQSGNSQSIAAVSSSPSREPPGQRQRLDEEGNAAAGSQETQRSEAQEVSDVRRSFEDLGIGGDEGSSVVHSQARIYLCPVPGCRSGSAETHRTGGWKSFSSLRSHVDAHLLGQLPGKPPAEWMTSGGWAKCRECGKLVSTRFCNHMHPTCVARRTAEQPAAVASAKQRARPCLLTRDIQHWTRYFQHR